MTAAQIEARLDALVEPAVRVASDDTITAHLMELVEALVVEQAAGSPDAWRSLHAQTQDALEPPIVSTLAAATALPEQGVKRWRNVELDQAPDLWGAWTEARRDELASAVRRFGQVKVLGGGWGMSRASHPRGTGAILVTSEEERAEGRRVRWGDSRRSVRCGLGATWADVHAFLQPSPSDPPRGALVNQPGFSGLSVAGTLAMGGHGSGLRWGPLDEHVRRLELTYVDTRVRSQWFERDHDHFPGVVTSLGRLGAVTEVELDVVGPYKLAEERTAYELDADPGRLAARIGEILDGAGARMGGAEVHSVEIWIAPYAVRGTHTYVLGVRSYTDRPLRPRSQLALTCPLLGALGAALAWLLRWGLPRLTPGLVRSALRMTVSTPGDPPVLWAADGLDFGAPNSMPMTACEASLPWDEAPNAIAALLSQLASQTAHGLYLSSPIGVRFVGPATATLAPAQGRPRNVLLEMPTFRYQHFLSESLLEPAQTLLARHHAGRPHWGQRVFDSTRPHLPSLWPDDLRRQFGALRATYDPNGHFANAFVDAFLDA